VNQGNVKWGCCFAAGSLAGGISYVGFGIAKGTGSNQSSAATGSNGAFTADNGTVWRDPVSGGTGSVNAFSGSTFNIAVNNLGGGSVVAMASAIGWT
jgi:hypothetical protein